MKRILTTFLAFLMLFSSVTIALANDEKVEISFKVGDSTLKINGQEVTVQTPFVAGEGTTLVPVRVITEAFGATVEWVAETKTVNITYREVNISLQIDNPVAKVNSFEETLPVAPRLVEGTTMVPLRFISETFGATVGYDEATKAISVVKEKIETGDIVEGGIKEAYVGDSYYKWTIDTPQGFVLTSRTYDGSSTVFASRDGKDMLYINVIPNLDNDSLERLQMDADELFEGGVLSYATYATNRDNVRYTYSYGTVMGKYQYIAQYVKDGIIYRVIVLTENDSQNKAYLEKITGTFSLKYNPGNPIYDLSNVEDGKRNYISEMYGVSFTVPAHFLKTYSKIDNEITLFSGQGDRSFVGIKVYSKNKDFSMHTYAKEDREHSLYILNDEITGCSPIKDYDLNGIKSTGFDITIKGSYSSDATWNKRFFEKGDYVYLLEVCKTKANKEDFATELFKSFTVEEIDSEEVGEIEKPQKTSGKTDHNVGGFFISAPNNWERYQDSKGFFMEEEETNSAVHFSYQFVNDVNSNYVVIDLSGQLSDNVGRIAEQYKGYVVEDITPTKWQGRTLYTATIQIDEDGKRIYLSFAMLYERGYLYVGQLAQGELHFKSDIYKEFLTMMASVK